MAMRVDCRHYESRTYASGEVVRKCRLDLAPEAPWRCPETCSGYERRTVDVGWHYGSLAEPLAAEPVPPPELGGDVAALLDAAEEIVNRAGMELAEEEAARRSRAVFKRGRRKKRR
ncbi:MAG TPA: hypothetical protein VFZ83_12865 [Acidimicrobiia bacterium]|nr:hypothetical protein [Acidimicrobiia bacterium]